jgi:hypothetical protein
MELPIRTYYNIQALILVVLIKPIKRNNLGLKQNKILLLNCRDVSFGRLEPL